MTVAEPEIKGVAAKITKDTGGAESAQKPWFCVARSPLDVVFKGSAESPAEFLDICSASGIAWVDYVARDADFDKEAVYAATQFGFSAQLISSFAGESYLNYQDFDTEMWMRLPSIQVRQLEVTVYPFLVLLRENFILTVHSLNVDRRFIRLRRYSERILKRIPLDVNPIDKLTMLLTRIVDENNERNFAHLRRIEERGDELNKILTAPFTPGNKLGPEIYYMKHAIIVYLDALWDSVDVLHTLRYGDAELISDDPKLLDQLGILAEDVKRQIGLAEQLSEVLASGLDALQTIYSNQLQNLNNRLALLMTYLTIIGTAVLVPNTLATMLSNAVFDIGPKDIGWYLVLMIGSTVVATGLVYWWVRRQGWIPRKMG